MSPLSFPEAVDSYDSVAKVGECCAAIAGHTKWSLNPCFHVARLTGQTLHLDELRGASRTFGADEKRLFGSEIMKRDLLPL